MRLTGKHHSQGTNIWRIDMDGSSLFRLTKGTFDQGPVCFPDGKQVACQTHLGSVSVMSSRLAFTNRLACRFKLTHYRISCLQSISERFAGRKTDPSGFALSGRFQSLCTRRTTLSRCRVTVLFPEFGHRTRNPPPEHADFQFPETVGLGRLRLRTRPHDGPRRALCRMAGILSPSPCPKGSRHATA